MSTARLEVVGTKPTEQIQQDLPEGEVVRLGRDPHTGLTVPWCKLISREHADLEWDGQQLHVTCIDTAKNPFVYLGRDCRDLLLPLGEEFWIGDTQFRLLVKEDLSNRDSIGVDESGKNFHERVISSQDLRTAAFGNPELQMELLSKLPEAISTSESDEDLAQFLVGMLMDAIPEAQAIAVTHFEEAESDLTESTLTGSSTSELPEPKVSRVQTRESFRGRFQPSRRLISQTLVQQESVIHIWLDQELDSSANFTVSKGLDWAFCTPIGGESSLGWCLYVSGKGGVVKESDLRGHLRFTELVAQFMSSIRQVRLLQQHKTQMSTFFSPTVTRSLTRSDAKDILAPAERDISVLFCDVRGFSRKAEELSHDLKQLLAAAKTALGAMAHSVLERNGTIADFQGDALLGFWGWPVELAEGPIPACLAALEVAKLFREGTHDQESLLYGFSIGIGIAHGRAIAGQIGTSEQAKVGVFGPVVNQGARLESLNRQFNTEICIDKSTADHVRETLPPDVARVRFLARVRPKGMNQAMNAYSLLPPESEFPMITDRTISDYEAAAEAVIEGRWSEALRMLESIPDDDGPKRFLLRHMDSRETPPSDWDGTFTMSDK